MRSALFIIGLACTLASGCSVVIQNRVFPKLDWYWSDDAKAERKYKSEQNVHIPTAHEWYAEHGLIYPTNVVQTNEVWRLK